MGRNARKMNCRPEDVFAVLEHGWLYPVWVVGASRIRDVSAQWPMPGAKLHHSVGIWPVMLNDTTSCLEWDPPNRAVLQARGWPIGEARVTLTVREIGGGCLVHLRERETDGPARLLPRKLVELLLKPRNRETLRRLSYLAEGMANNSSETTAPRE